MACVLISVTNRIGHELCNLRPTKIRRTRRFRVQQAIHGDEGRSRCDCGRKRAIRWKSAVKSPRYEDWLVDNVKVRQAANMKSAHNL
jgi:hypothetical protein